MLSQEEGTEAWEFIVGYADRCIGDTLRAGFIDQGAMVGRVLERTERYIDRFLEGYCPDAESRVRYMTELLSYVPQPAQSLRSVVKHCVDTAFTAQAIEEVTWPSVTDNDRLNSAFEALEAQGVLARQDFTDCKLCGYDALKEEAREKRLKGINVRGWVFYDWENTEEAMQGNGLYLQYRCAPGCRNTTPGIGREIVAVLRARNLCPEWSDKSEDAIRVPMVWQRRVASVPNDPSSNAIKVETLAAN